MKLGDSNIFLLNNDSGLSSLNRFMSIFELDYNFITLIEQNTIDKFKNFLRFASYDDSNILEVANNNKFRLDFLLINTEDITSTKELFKNFPIPIVYIKFIKNDPTVFLQFNKEWDTMLYFELQNSPNDDNVVRSSITMNNNNNNVSMGKIVGKLAIMTDVIKNSTSDIHGYTKNLIIKTNIDNLRKLS